MKNKLKKKKQISYLPRCKQTRIKRLFLNTTVKLESFDPMFSSFRFTELFTTDQFSRSSWEVILGRLAKPMSDFASVAV